jgi:hypothetical protein
VQARSASDRGLPKNALDHALRHGAATLGSIQGGSMMPLGRLNELGESMLEFNGRDRHLESGDVAGLQR